MLSSKLPKAAAREGDVLRVGTVSFPTFKSSVQLQVENTEEPACKVKSGQAMQKRRNWHLWNAYNISGIVKVGIFHTFLDLILKTKWNGYYHPHSPPPPATGVKTKVKVTEKKIQAETQIFLTQVYLFPHPNTTNFLCAFKFFLSSKSIHLLTLPLPFTSLPFL